MSYFKAKMHQIPWGALYPTGGAYSAPSDTLAGRPLSRLAANFTAGLAFFAAYSRLSRNFRVGGGSAVA